MLQLLISLLGILFTIFFVIGTHEAAHFITARLLGIKILRFSIGFGKTIFRWFDKHGTEYVIALVPLGGYVKMLDENEGSVPPQELPYAFNRQPFYKKFLVVLAGPAMNLFCAFILYWIIFVIGFISIKPIIGNVVPHSIAAASGLTANQEIIRIDHKDVRAWPGILFRLVAHAGSKDQAIIETVSPRSPAVQKHVLDLSHWQGLDGLTPDPLGSLGITPYEPKVPLMIGVITAASPATASSLQVGDTILAINGHAVKDWNEVIVFVFNHPEQLAHFTLIRQGKTVTVPVKIGYKRSLTLQKYGYLGVAPHFDWPPNLLKKTQYKPLPAISYALQEVYDFTYFNLLLFGKMLTGKLSLQSLGGPITIFETAGEALNYGFLAFLAFLAFLSVSIGVINLLPIPGLDGGHLLFQLVELIIRRPIPESVLLLFYRFGFILILLVLFQALVNDILRLV